MSPDYPSEIHLDANGLPDVEHYVSEAKRCRDQALSELSHVVLGWLQARLARRPLASS